MQRSEYQQPGTQLESRADAVAELQKVVEEVPKRLASLSDADASLPRSEGKWSCGKEIVGHLIDSATNNHHRFVRAQIERSLDMPGYAQNEWMAVQNYPQRNWIELVRLWTAYNQSMLHLMKNAPEKLWTFPAASWPGMLPGRWSS